MSESICMGAISISTSGPVTLTKSFGTGNLGLSLLLNGSAKGKAGATKGDLSKSSSTPKLKNLFFWDDSG